VGRERAARAAEFARQAACRLFDLSQRAPDTGGVHRHLFAERGGRGRLTVGARQHRHVAVLASDFRQRVLDARQFREDHVLHGVAHQ